jgi:hypothetical protein
MTPLDEKGNTVTCPLCDGHGDIDKQAAVKRWRSGEFRENMREIETSITQPSDEMLVHHSWKD